jgi:hypothetical protein
MNLNLIKASNGSGEAVRATITDLRLAGSTTNKVNSVANWPTPFIATSGKREADGTLSRQLVFEGHLSGSDVIIDTLAPGYTDTQGNQAGDVILIKPSTRWADLIASFLAVSHGDDGTLNAAALAQTLANMANKELRLKPRIVTTTSTATLSPNIDTATTYEVSAQAATLTIANPAGTANNGDVLLFRIKDNGTARTINYGTAYVNVSGLDLLTATTANKWHYIGVQYNLAAGKWHIISATTEA